MKEKIFELKKEDPTYDYLSYCLDNTNKGKLIDLGCGHGNHSRIARDKGFEVTGLDGRSVRIPVKDKGITWEIGFVENANIAEYDIVLVSGILYHLTLEAQLNLFDKLLNSNVHTLIVNTHFVIFDNNTPQNKMFKMLLTAKIEIQGGYHYSYYDEREDYIKRPEAAINNRLSCWFTFDSLIRLIKEKAGFSDITILKPLLTEDRCWLLCKR
jgi:SAM-dependent methyltransferase